jgi:CHASE domain
LTAPRLATLEQARDTGRTTVSNRTALPGDLDLPPSRRPVAFELFVPVYRTELPAGASVTARRRQYLGWAVGQFRAGDFLEAALGSLPPPRTTGVELHDGELGDDSLIASYPEGFRATGPYVRTASFTYGERTFTLRIAPLPGGPLRPAAVRGPARPRPLQGLQRPPRPPGR